MELPVTFKCKNQQIVGILHRPNDKEKHPAVILCHGLFSTKSEVKYVKLARALCKNNFVVLRFDFRGCGDSEGKEEDYCFSSEIEDIGAALKFLLRQKYVDKNRIGLLGHSHGGASVVFAASKYEKFIKSLVVSGAPAVPKKIGPKRK